MTRHRTPFIRAVAIVAVLIAAFAASGTAGAATTCSKAILDDWLDNDRIDRIYDLSCYEAAIDAIPEDIRIYTNAEEVISRAFQNVSGKRLERQLEGPSSVAPPPPAVVPAVSSSASTAFPLPLLVLGGMSAVLLAAGGFGYVSRRRRQN